MAGTFISLSDLMKVLSILKAHSAFVTHGFLPTTVRSVGRSLESSRVIATLVTVTAFPSQKLFGLPRNEGGTKQI